MKKKTYADTYAVSTNYLIHLATKFNDDFQDSNISTAPKYTAVAMNS